MSPSTGCPRVFVAPTKARRPSSSSERTSISTPAISSIFFTAFLRFLASRIAAVATVRIASAPELLRELDLSADDVADLGDLVLGHGSVPLRVGADLRVGALLHDFAELAFLRLGDEHARGVRADVDRRAEHRQVPRRVWQTERITQAVQTPDNGLFTSHSPDMTPDLGPVRAKLSLQWRNFSLAVPSIRRRTRTGPADVFSALAGRARSDGPARMVAVRAPLEVLRGGRFLPRPGRRAAAQRARGHAPRHPSRRGAPRGARRRPGFAASSTRPPACGSERQQATGRWTG